MGSRDDQPKGRAKGGVARAEKLTPERRSEIARKAALARRMPKATHRGNFQQDFGIDVDCYVLDDDHKTAVISQRGMGAALGLTTSGQSFIRFASGKTIAPYLGAEVRDKIEKPLKFQWVPRGADKQPAGELNGYDVTLLIDVCKAIVSAETEDKLLHHQRGLAKQAHIILNASAKAGIKGLVYALAGYEATREQVVAAFKMFVAEEAREYEKEFPPQLYSEWYRLYEIPVYVRGRPWNFKSLTIDHVYYPLARSSGRVLQLIQAQRAGDPERNKKLHQFLSDLGVKALRTQVGQLLGIARIAKSKAEYESHVKTLFGDQPDLPGLEPV